jgi:hypothetical protein
MFEILRSILVIIKKYLKLPQKETMKELNNLKKNGFSKINGVFSLDEISKLRHESIKILDCPNNV